MRPSEALREVEKLAQPFRYQLLVHTEGQTRQQLLGIPETFNDLLGLHVQMRRVYAEDGRHSVVNRDRMNHGNTAVIWCEAECRQGKGSRARHGFRGHAETARRCRRGLGQR